MSETARKRPGIPRPKARQYPDQAQTGLSVGPLAPMPEIAASVRATRQRLYGPMPHTSNGNGSAPASSARSKLKNMASNKPNKRIVSPNPEGGWDVRAPNAQRVSAHERTQAGADKRAAQILRNDGGGERITQGRDGKIRSKDTIAPGNDPNPPRDKEH